MRRSRSGLVSKRLAACLLMVDPWNPVFSDRRRALLRHVPATARIANAQEQLLHGHGAGDPRRGGDRRPGCAGGGVRQALGGGRGFRGEFNRILRRYYDSVEARLKTQAGFDAYFKLAEERRQEFKAKMPIAEFPLLLPQTNIRARGRTMQRDGTVTAG